jgi:hypothetical protein
MKITIKTLQQKVFHVSFPLFLVCRRCLSSLVPGRGGPRGDNLQLKGEDQCRPGSSCGVPENNLLG